VNERRLGLVDEAKRLRDEGRSHFEIAALLRVSLSDVRRALDPKAREAHKRWAA
jgi:predicted transcriptional regulator